MFLFFVTCFLPPFCSNTSTYCTFHQMPETNWVLCECGRSYKYSNDNVRYASLSRCRANHYDETVLQLPKGTIDIKRCLWVVMSDAGQKHHHRRLRAQLLAAGVSQQDICIVYGFKYGTDAAVHLGKAVSYNGITHFSSRHRWLPKVASILSHARRGKYTMVYYLESDAILEVDVLTMLEDIRVNSHKQSDLLWMGWRRLHRGGPMNRISKTNLPIIEGSKCIGFRRSGLVQLHNLFTQQKRYCHLDLLLARTTPTLYRCKTSFFGSRAHLSIPLSKGGAPKQRPAFRVMKWHTKKMFHVFGIGLDWLSRSCFNALCRNNFCSSCLSSVHY